MAILLVGGIRYAVDRKARIAMLPEPTPEATPMPVPPSAPRLVAKGKPTPKPIKIARSERYVSGSGGVSRMQRIGGGGGGSSGYTVVMLGTGEPRPFELEIAEVTGHGAAVATGVFYENGERKEAGEVYVVGGLPEGIVDGVKWSGWLERAGTNTIPGTYETVPSYRIVAAQNLPPSRATTPQAIPGAWMWDEKHRSRQQGER